MAPKHGLTGIKEEEEQIAKRPKSTQTSRSSTPAAELAKPPFQVEYPDLESKKARSKYARELADAAEFMESPFIANGREEDGELDQYYTVTPVEEWNSMKKYNNFIIQGEVYKSNQFVFVRGEFTPKDKDTEGQPKDFWVARILQVRAKNAQHVYALVTWMYWPEELPPSSPKQPDQKDSHSGKRTYHGAHELVASNYMEVLDVLSFAGKADIDHWDEQDDNLMSRLYWRQTFNRKTQKLSKLRQHCICNGHYNPDVPMWICDNPECKLWVHVKEPRSCLIDDILSKTYTKLVLNSQANGAPTSTKKKTKAKPWKGVFKAVVRESNGEIPKVCITDLRPDAEPATWEEDILCPKCDAIMSG